MAQHTKFPVLFVLTISFCAIFLKIHTTHSQLTPWYEEKYSHTLKELSTDEYAYLANNVSDIDLLSSLLESLMLPRLPATSNHSIVKENIISHFINLGWHVEADIFEATTPYGQTPFENIIVTLNHNVPRRLVLACHYETKNFSNNPGFVGAIDSAVPCAMLLHLGSALNDEFRAHKNDPSQNVSLQFIFFDGEEAFRFWTPSDSIYGSRHLASSWENTPYPSDNPDNTTYLNRMDILMLLDLLGSQDPTFNNFSLRMTHWHIELFRIEQALRRSRYWNGSTGSKAYFQAQFMNSNISDDQIPFLQRNVQVIHMIDYPFPSVWHTIRDTEENLDYDTIYNLCRIVRIFVAKYIHLPFLH